MFGAKQFDVDIGVMARRTTREQLDAPTTRYPPASAMPNKQVVDFRRAQRRPVRFPIGSFHFNISPGFSTRDRQVCHILSTEPRCVYFHLLMWYVPQLTSRAASSGARPVEFIFMLTRNDRTVDDALDVLELIRPVGLKHIGFKDVGADPASLSSLVEAIHDTGAKSYMEVVSTTDEECIRSAQLARDLGVQRLLGGTQVELILSILHGSSMTYFPFPGRPVDHPTKLGGTPDDVSTDCRRFVEAGCAGCDLLAYRATEAHPLDLVRAAREGLGPEPMLIVAGAVNSARQISDLHDVGADAFTIGTAVFDGSYSPSKGSILSQLNDVLTDCARV